jgi:hypothetical protein
MDRHYAENNDDRWYNRSLESLKGRGLEASGRDRRSFCWRKRKILRQGPKMILVESTSGIGRVFDHHRLIVKVVDRKISLRQLSQTMTGDVFN